jgi:hypothetical protein
MEERFRWLLLSFAPSSLLLSTTYHITVDLAPVPLLWMVPLGVYLATFIVAFSTFGRPWALSLRSHALVSVMALVLLLFDWDRFLKVSLTAEAWLRLNIGLALLVLALLGLVCHAMLAASAPAPSRLTEFYLFVSLGGVLGSAMNSLLAPLLFLDNVEYFIALAAACWLLPARESLQERCTWSRDALAAAAVLLATALCVLFLPLPYSLRLSLPLLACLAAWAWPVRFGPLFAAAVAVIVAVHFLPQPGRLYRERTFFGALVVSARPLGLEPEEEQFLHVLYHGTTLHGVQAFGEPDRIRLLPLSYYSGPGPIGQVFEAARRKQSLRPVGVIGLGAGTLAAYGRPGQHLTFYEIDPAVERIARNPALFTFLKDSKATCDVVLGDARLRLQEAEDGEFGILVVDAFSSDAIPIHLITTEAIDLYLSKIDEQGTIAFHISNRYLDLEPVLANIARRRSLVCLVQQAGASDRDRARGLVPSQWVVLARNKKALGVLAQNPAWQEARRDPSVGVWTDQFANVLATLKSGPSR